MTTTSFLVFIRVRAVAEYNISINAMKNIYESPVVIMYEIKLEQGFATSTEPIKTDPEQGWD